MLCCCAKHIAFTVPLSIQDYKWGSLMKRLGTGGERKGNLAMDWHPIRRGVVIHDKLQLDGPHGSIIDLTSGVKKTTPQYYLKVITLLYCQAFCSVV